MHYTNKTLAAHSGSNSSNLIQITWSHLRNVSILTRQRFLADLMHFFNFLIYTLYILMHRVFNPLYIIDKLITEKWKVSFIQTADMVLTNWMTATDAHHWKMITHTHTNTHHTHTPLCCVSPWLLQFVADELEGCLLEAACTCTEWEHPPSLMWYTWTSFSREREMRSFVSVPTVSLSPLSVKSMSFKVGLPLAWQHRARHTWTQSHHILPHTLQHTKCPPSSESCQRFTWSKVFSLH